NFPWKLSSSGCSEQHCFRSRASAHAQAPAISRESQKCNLPAYGGCAVAAGIIRLQTGADEDGRSGLSALSAGREKIRFYPGSSENDGSTGEIQPARTIRGLGK